MNLLASQEGTSKPGIKVWEDHDRRLLTCFIMTCLNQASFFFVHSSSDDVGFTFIT